MEERHQVPRLPQIPRVYVNRSRSRRRRIDIVSQWAGTKRRVNLPKLRWKISTGTRLQRGVEMVLTEPMTRSSGHHCQPAESHSRWIGMPKPFCRN
jgi:hypothetical protein